MTPQIPGVEEVLSWFGRWPSFHDAEIVSVHLNRGGTSMIRVHTWNLGTGTDEQGRFVREREAIVVFELERIRWLEMAGEDADVQNVVSCVLVDRTADGFRLHLGPSYGLAGEILAKTLRVRLEPLPSSN